MNLYRKQSPGRVACLDFGLKRIGVAISDETRTIASPLTTVIASKSFNNTAKSILELLSKYEPKIILIGLPLYLNGLDSEISLKAKKFAEILKSFTTNNEEIIMWDERLSSKQADNILIECGLSSKNKKDKRDQVAASVILQSYLEQ